MNFTPELSAFQGVVVSADNIHSFARISARGGNEHKILDIVSTIFNFLEEKQYLIKEGITEKAKSDLRKFTFYLVLNADLPILEEMVELPGIDMVIWTVPTITKCLLCEMVWGLSLESFLYEIISFCCPELSLQVVEPFLDSIKVCTPTNCMDKLKIISTACYRFICRLNFFSYDNNDLTAALSEMFEYFLRCITYFIAPPNDYKLNSFSEDERYKYIGNNLSSMIAIIMECLNLYTSVEKFYAEGFKDMYLCTIKPDKIRTRSLEHRICDFSEGVVTDYLHKCHTALMDELMSLVMEVSVDIFCAWSEFEENGKTFQQTIGERCYILHSKLQRVPSVSDHPVVNMLPQISCKPVDIHDEIRAADNETIIENINNNCENKAIWLEALLQKEDLQENKNLVECLIKNVESVKANDCYNMVQTFIDKLKDNIMLDEKVLLLAVKLFSQCDNERKVQLLDSHFEEKVFKNTLENSETDIMMTEVFNKLIATPDPSLSDIYTLFLQNPLKTYTKILSTACENDKQCGIMLKIMTNLQKYTNHYYSTDTETCITKSIETYSQNNLGTDKQKDNFINFVIELKRAEILSGPKLLLLIVMPKLHKSLIDKNLDVINIQVKLLDGAYDISELLPFRAPLLAMLAQVLEAVRWTILTFTGIAPCALENTLLLVMKLFNTFENVIPEKESTWLKVKLRNLSPLNMYYYRMVWNPPGDNFIEVISGNIQMTTDELAVFLTKVLCIATIREWSEIWDSMTRHGDAEALDVFYNTLSLMMAAEKDNRTESTNACLQYCYRNLVLITKEKYLTEPLTAEKIKTALEKMVVFVNMVDDADFQDIGNSFLSLFSYIAERRNNIAVDLTSLISDIKQVEFSTVVKQLFPPVYNGS